MTCSLKNTVLSDVIKSYYVLWYLVGAHPYKIFNNRGYITQNMYKVLKIDNASEGIVEFQHCY